MDLPVKDTLNVDESGWLPILLNLRQIGAFLKAHHHNDDGLDGHSLLLAFLYRSLERERIKLPETFFDDWLRGDRAVVLFDGLDEGGGL